MVIFHSYIELPEGRHFFLQLGLDGHLFLGTSPGTWQAKKRMAEAKKSTASTGLTGGVSPLTQPLAKKEIVQARGTRSTMFDFLRFKCLSEC